MGVRSACRYASFVVCHPAPPSQRVQFVDTTTMMPAATMNMRIRHANSNSLFQSMPGLVKDQLHVLLRRHPPNHRPGRVELTNHFLRTPSWSSEECPLKIVEDARLSRSGDNADRRPHCGTPDPSIGNL